jgi:RNA polymerase sigma factor for flagellar operon FliA
LETLILRDRYTFDEAFEILRTNLQIAVPRHDLEALWNTLPERTRRSFASECELQQIPASAGGPDAGLARTLAAATASTACETLARAIAALPTQDGLILALRYYDGLRVQQIAKALRLEAKPLYRRIERILSELRRRLEGAGISAAEILEAMAAEGFEAIGEGAPGESARAVRRFDRGASAPMADGRAQ